jgi:hypothetical protein
MQTGHVTPGATTEQIIGPVAGASWVTLFGASGEFYLASSAGIDVTVAGNRGELCELNFPETSGVITFRIGEGESVYVGSSYTNPIDYVVFPE